MTDRSTGRLVAPGDDHEMAEALMWLAASRDRRRQSGAAGRALVAGRFGMRIASSRRLPLMYEEVLADRGSR